MEAPGQSSVLEMWRSTLAWNTNKYQQIKGGPLVKDPGKLPCFSSPKSGHVEHALSVNFPICINNNSQNWIGL